MRNVFLSFAVFCSVASAAPRTVVEQFPIMSSDQSFECSSVPAVACSGILPPRSEHESEVALLLDKNTGFSGEISLTARLQSLVKARRSIRIQALIFTGDEAGLRVAKILKDKKAANPHMDIRVIVDAMSNLGPQTQWMYYDLKQHGIEVEGYEAAYLGLINEVSVDDLTRINKRFHDKIWVVDGEEPEGVAIVGGLNVANEYFRIDRTPKNRWRDQDVIARGAVVRDIVAAFDRNYDYFKKIKAAWPDFLNTDKYWETARGVIKQTGKLPIFYLQNKKLALEVEKALTRKLSLKWEPARTRFFQSRPRFEETYIHQAYLGLIQGASHPGGEILIANAYFVPEPEIRQALVNAVAKGARVMVLTNSLETNDLPPLSYASRYLYNELINAGVEIFEYAGKRFGEGTIHAKFAVFDREVALVGSYNLDARSQKLNSETALVLESSKLAGELADQFITRDLTKSDLITRSQAEAWHNAKGAEGLNMQLSNKLAPML